MRGADVGPAARICALSALMVGLYYDASALDEAFDLVRNWSAEQRQKLRDNVPRVALDATIAGRRLGDIGAQILSIARASLSRRARLNEKKQDEAIYLGPLDKIIETGHVAAQDWIVRFRNDWNGDIDPVFAEACY
jgi:glutamate--cysteine ligase